MKKYLTIISCLLSFGIANGSAVPILYPGNDDLFTSKKNSFVFDPAKAKIKEVEKLLGRKMKLKEKVAFKIFQWKLKKGLVIKHKETKRDKGQTAMLFGIIALASLLIPFFGGLPFIVFTVLALVFGYEAKKENPENRKAKTAILLGWIGVGLFVLALAVVIAVLATWSSWG